MQFQEFCRFLATQFLLDRFCKRTKDYEVRSDEDLAALIDFCQISAACNTEIRKKSTKDWKLWNFEAAADLLLSLEEGTNLKMDNSPSTFKDALEVLKWTKASGFLDKIPLTDKKVTFYTV